jgi:hypothetical protein
LDCQILLILGERNEQDTGAPARRFLDHGLREPAAEIFQDPMMVVEPALQFGAAGEHGSLLAVQFTLDLEQQVPLILFSFPLFLVMSVIPDQIEHNSGSYR